MTKLDLSGVVFARDLVTTRLASSSVALAVDANALLEDAIAATSGDAAVPFRRIRGPADRYNAVVPTRFGDLQIAAWRDADAARRWMLSIGSVGVSTPIPWSTPDASSTARVLSMLRDAVRAVVLTDAGDAARRDLRARCAAALAADPTAWQAEATAPTPWSHGSIQTHHDGRPFGNQRRHLKARRAMEVRLVVGGTTPGRVIGPRLDLTPLTVRLDRREGDAVERMRLLARAEELRAEDGGVDDAA